MNSNSKNPLLRVFVDTEYCYPNMKKTDPRPTAQHERKIVQIAAILYDVANGKEIKAFNRLTKPAFGEKVTPFFEELTGITQVEIDAGAGELPDVIADFATFCSTYEVWTFDKDEEVLDKIANTSVLNFLLLARLSG
jgi:inhibitor of KinA sporulation pathway (predicted exonuclease)